MSTGYFITIPGDVRRDSRLSPSAKLLYGDLAGLCSLQGFCWAKNNYLAGIHGVSERAIQKQLELLEECGYIHVDIEQGHRRQIRLTERGCPKVHTPMKNRSPGGEKRDTPNTNNTVNSQDTKIELPRPSVWESGFFGNEATALLMDELLVWLQNKKKVKHLPPQKWYDVFVELNKIGIPLSEFQDYYTWVENLNWLKGAVNEKLLLGQVENYLRREEFDERNKRREKKSGAKNGRRPILEVMRELEADSGKV